MFYFIKTFALNFYRDKNMPSRVRDINRKSTWCFPVFCLTATENQTSPSYFFYKIIDKGGNYNHLAHKHTQLITIRTYRQMSNNQWSD